MISHFHLRRYNQEDVTFKGLVNPQFYLVPLEGAPKFAGFEGSSPEDCWTRRSGKLYTNMSSSKQVPSKPTPETEKKNEPMETWGSPILLLGFVFLGIFSIIIQ